jgi:hypothetical protein
MGQLLDMKISDTTWSLPSATHLRIPPYVMVSDPDGLWSDPDGLSSHWSFSRFRVLRVISFPWMARETVLGAEVADLVALAQVIQAPAHRGREVGVGNRLGGEVGKGPEGLWVALSAGSDAEQTPDTAGIPAHRPGSSVSVAGGEEERPARCL